MFVIDYNACLSSPCQHNGRCKKSKEGFRCVCKGNFEGNTCSGRCYALVLSVHYTFQRNSRAHLYARFVACTHKYVNLHFKVSIGNAYGLRQFVILLTDI